MKLDKIYVINLEYRKDRKTQILNELKKVDASNVEIFSAIRPKEGLINHWNHSFLNPLPTWYRGNATNYRIGALGCLLSHLTIMKKVKFCYHLTSVKCIKDKKIKNCRNNFCNKKAGFCALWIVNRYN